MSELLELRKLALQGQRAVGNKISRIRNRENAPVDIAGTRFDPRIPRSRIDKLNRKQLIALIQRQNAFRSRGTNFYGGAAGRIITKAAADRFKRVEREYNRRAIPRDTRFDKIRLPGQDMTVGQAKATRQPKFPTMQGNSRNRLGAPSETKLSRVNGEKALRILERQLKKQTRPEYFDSRLKARRRQVMRTIEKTGDVELIEKFKQLDSDRFDLLWNHVPKFIEAVVIYDSGDRDTNPTKNARFTNSVMDDQYAEAKKYIEWAYTLQLEEQEAKKNARKRSR